MVQFKLVSLPVCPQTRLVKHALHYTLHGSGKSAKFDMKLIIVIWILTANSLVIAKPIPVPQDEGSEEEEEVPANEPIVQTPPTPTGSIPAGLSNILESNGPGETVVPENTTVETTETVPDDVVEDPPPPVLSLDVDDTEPEPAPRAVPVPVEAEPPPAPESIPVEAEPAAVPAPPPEAEEESVLGGFAQTLQDNAGQIAVGGIGVASVAAVVGYSSTIINMLKAQAPPGLSSISDKMKGLDKGKLGELNSRLGKFKDGLGDKVKSLNPLKGRTSGAGPGPGPGGGEKSGSPAPPDRHKIEESKPNPLSERSSSARQQQRSDVDPVQEKPSNLRKPQVAVTAASAAVAAAAADLNHVQMVLDGRAPTAQAQHHQPPTPTPIQSVYTASAQLPMIVYETKTVYYDILHAYLPKVHGNGKAELNGGQLFREQSEVMRRLDKIMEKLYNEDGHYAGLSTRAREDAARVEFVGDLIATSGVKLSSLKVSENNKDDLAGNPNDKPTATELEKDVEDSRRKSGNLAPSMNFEELDGHMDSESLGNQDANISGSYESLTGTGGCDSLILSKGTGDGLSGVSGFSGDSIKRHANYDRHGATEKLSRSSRFSYSVGKEKSISEEDQEV